MACGFLLLIPTGCQFSSTRTNSLSLTLLRAEVQSAQSTRDRLDRELWRLQEEINSMRQRNAETEAELSKVDVDHEAKATALAQKLQHLRAMEEDLAAARQREAVVKKVLLEVTALEQKAAQKEKLLRELGTKNADLEKQLAASQAAVKAKEASVQKLVSDLQARLAARNVLVPKLRAALDAAKAMGVVASPPPAKEPPAKKPPAKQAPPKKD
jgi:septal ring factor EnvC (AmiA/AmiB activator)